MKAWASDEHGVRSRTQLMGAANSNLTRCLDRLRKQGRDHLVVDEVLVLRLPASSWSLDTSHLGVLFMLDR